MSKSTGYPTCSRTRRMGSCSHSSPPPLPFFGSFQTGLLFNCLWVSFKLIPKTIHHQVLRIVLGAFRTSPVQSLYEEAHETPSYSLGFKLSLNYVIKLNSCPTNPANSGAFEPQNAKFYEKSQFFTPRLGLRMLPHLESSGLDGRSSCLDLGLCSLVVLI